MLATLALAALIGALPPPACRGKVYSAYDPKQDRAAGARALAEVRAAYESLCPQMNCGVGQVFQNPTIGNNAVTWVSGLNQGQGTRAKIVYSTQFLDGLDAAFGPGASFGVLAHEVGHHLTAALAMRTPFERTWNEELRADYLAGCALGRAGRRPDELENALRALVASGTRTHPPFNLRTTVVRKGYDACRAETDRVKRPSFGIGAELKVRASSEGCWSYFYRAASDIARVGPVAARRMRSRRFTDQPACEASRAELPEASAKTSEECACD